MLTKAEQAKADRSMQSIASLAKSDGPEVLSWLRDGWKREVFLLEDISSGKNSTVSEIVRKWLSARNNLPEEMRSVSAFQTPGDMIRAVPQGLQEEAISDRQGFLLDRDKARMESWSRTFPSGMTLTVPLTAFAATVYSRGTTWCTGALKNNVFSSYAEKSPILIMRLPDGSMFQATFDMSPDELAKNITDDNINNPDFVSNALKEYIVNGLTIKNGTDDNLTEDEYNKIIPYLSDIVPMVSKQISASFRDLSSYVGNAGEERGHKAVPLFDESVISTHLQDAIRGTVRFTQNLTMEKAQFTPLSLPKEPEPAGSPDDLLTALSDRSVDRIMAEMRVILKRSGDQPAVVLEQFGKRVSDDILLKMVHAIGSNDIYGTTSDNGVCHALIRSLGGVRFGELMADCWNMAESGDVDSTGYRKKSCQIMSVISDPGMSEAYSSFMRIMRSGYQTPGLPSFHDFLAIRTELSSVDDARMLPESILAEPWLDTSSRASVKLGFLAAGVDRMKEDGLDHSTLAIMGMAKEYSIITEDMKSFPEGVMRVFFPDGINEDGIMEAAFLLASIKEESLDDDEGWDDHHIVLADALVSHFDKVHFSDNDRRMACIVALASIDRKAIKLAPREHRWLFEAVSFRGTLSLGFFYQKVMTTPIRSYVDSFENMAESFLKENGVPAQEVGRLIATAVMSSAVPHPDRKVINLLESVSQEEMPQDRLEQITAELAVTGAKQINGAIESLDDVSRNLNGWPQIDSDGFSEVVSKSLNDVRERFYIFLGEEMPRILKEEMSVSVTHILKRNDGASLQEENEVVLPNPSHCPSSSTLSM